MKNVDSLGKFQGPGMVLGFRNTVTNKMPLQNLSGKTAEIMQIIEKIFLLPFFFYKKLVIQ